MHSTSQVFVTLSPDLVRHVCELARTQDVPIQWIVAGIYPPIRSIQAPSRRRTQIF